MPSYDELDNEVWWTREYEPPALAKFNSRLRAFYSLTPVAVWQQKRVRHQRSGWQLP